LKNGKDFIECLFERKKGFREFPEFRQRMQMNQRKVKIQGPSSTPEEEGQERQLKSQKTRK
jgi:hypothetical protein